MDNQRGTQWGFTLIMAFLLLFVIPIAAIGVSDYYQINNIKDSVDREIKRAITDTMVEKVMDNTSAERQVNFNYIDLKQDIKKNAIYNIKQKYNLDLIIDDADIRITIDDKVNLYYEGYVLYDPVMFNGPDQLFKIIVKGRSKIQRFDR